MKLYGHHVYSPILMLVLLELGIGVLVFVCSALFLDPQPSARQIDLLVWGAIFGLAITIGMTSMGLYQAKQRLTSKGVLARQFVGLLASAVIIALVNLVTTSPFNDSVLLVSFIVAAFALGLIRVTSAAWLDHELLQRRVLILGAGSKAASLLKLRRRSDRRGFEIKGFVRTTGDDPGLEDSRVIVLDEPLAAYAKRNRVDQIVVAMDDRRKDFPIDELLTCKFSGVDVVDLLDFLEREAGKVMVEVANPAWLIFSEGSRNRIQLRFFTRIFDLVSASLLILLALPVILSVALAILILDGGPVLFRQSRVGYQTKPFTLYKFRTMVRGAERDGEARWAGAGDIRITKVGAPIRKMRLDELPQLFNVLRGNMSLVGPRPERPEFVDSLSKAIPFYNERHCVKPGITGWAQLSYPYGASVRDAEEKLAYDLYHIKHKSVIFDLMVLLQTIEVIFWGKGAR